MSSRDWEFRIRDIIEAIQKIQKYMRDMTLNEFKKNDLIIDAVIRNFEIIGEASKSVPLSFRRSHQSVPWDQMTAMRNLLIHEYFGVDAAIVWHTAKHHLPKLQKQLEKIL